MRFPQRQSPLNHSRRFLPLVARMAILSPHIHYDAGCGQAQQAPTRMTNSSLRHGHPVSPAGMPPPRRNGRPEVATEGQKGSIYLVRYRVNDRR